MLAKRLHPDVPNGNAEWFKEMVEEYVEVQELLSRRPSQASRAADREEPRPAPAIPAFPTRQKPERDELDGALDGLADATGIVISAWLKSMLHQRK
jgi:hypothetical protein